MSINSKRREEIIEDFQRDPDDTGSSEVQIALLTEEISSLTEHVEEHPQDHSSRRGLLQKVGKRQSLLNYLRDNNEERYKDVIQKLDINH